MTRSGIEGSQNVWINGTQFILDVIIIEQVSVIKIEEEL